MHIQHISINSRFPIVPPFNSFLHLTIMRGALPNLHPLYPWDLVLFYLPGSDHTPSASFWIFIVRLI